MNLPADLLLDFGNSRLKWALACSGQLGPMSAVVAAEPWPTLFAGLWSHLATPAQVVCVSVGHSKQLELLARFVDKHWGCPLHIVQTQHRAGRLVNAYNDPTQMGADRWVAMLGAAARCRGAFAVVDAGTALTVDIVDADGHHQGGWIIPGRALMNQALTVHTEKLSPRLIDSGPALGHDTRACIAGGVSAAQLGALELMKRRLPDPCQILICGGDSKWVTKHIEEADCQPDLVLQGLVAWRNTNETAGKN